MSYYRDCSPTTLAILMSSADSDEVVAIREVVEALSASDLEIYNKAFSRIEVGRKNERIYAAAPDLYAALKSVWEMIECGQLVRNTSNDLNANWAIRQIPFITALKKSQDAIAKAEGR